MKLEKIKQKIAEGYKDESIALMAGMTADEVAKIRTPAPEPKAAPKKAAKSKKN